MISKDQLDTAAKEGIISPAQVAPLLVFLQISESENSPRFVVAEFPSRVVLP